MTVQAGSFARRLACGALFLVPAAAGAQVQASMERPALVGMVRDSAGHAVAGAELRFQDGVLLARTNDSGGFRIASAPVGTSTLSVRRLGFAPASTKLTLRAAHVDSLVLTLSLVATELAGVLVEDEAMDRSHRFLAGFWERKARGFGSFITRDDIVKRDTREFTDLVRMMPSVRVTTNNGRQFIAFRGANGDCPPQYFVDGIRIEQGSPDEFNPDDVEAIELYPGAATTPPQFARSMFARTCGAIVIWTRLPG